MKLTRGYLEHPGRKTYTLRSPVGIATLAVFYRHGEAVGTSLDIHRRTPRNDGDKSRGPCEFLNGEPCYFDGTSTRPVPESPEDAYKTLEAWYGSELRES